MLNFDDINSLKNNQEKKEKFIEYYKNVVNINSWLNIQTKKIILKFKDRTEYKKFNVYHRINGPAIDYNNETLDKYYYIGVLYSKEEWSKITLREVRRLKLKKINKNES